LSSLDDFFTATFSTGASISFSALTGATFLTSTFSTGLTIFLVTFFSAADLIFNFPTLDLGSFTILTGVFLGIE
jgi:hypothetical protein